MSIPASSFALLALSLCLAQATHGQRLKTVKNDAHGIKMKVYRACKVIPPQPLEEQILVKWKGMRMVKEMKKEAPFEVWVVRIAKKKSAAKTPGRGETKEKKAGSLTEQKRRALNGGHTVEDFLKRRRLPADRMDDYKPKRAIKDKEKRVYKCLEYPSPRGRDITRVGLRTYFVESDEEYFGLVFLCPVIVAFEKDIESMVRSLRLTEKSSTAGAASKDPYEDSKLTHIDKRRKVRAKMVAGWKAYDTENFILVTNLVDNSKNRQLVWDMLVEMEVMREEYKKHFPPIQEVTAVSTVRVCKDYKQYMAYGSPRGTGGYWNFVDEELVLFDPNGKIGKKAAWMKKVSSKAILYHEAMHQYFHYSNGDMPPAPWFNEGYGEFFGASKIDRYQKKIRKIGKNAFRLQWIKDAKKADEWPDLKLLLKMNQMEFYGRIKVKSGRGKKRMDALKNYAFGWAFCYFLEMEKQKRPKERNETWVAIPANYIKNLRAAADEYREKLPANAPKGALIRWAAPIQAKAFKATFKDIDLIKLERAWIETMKTW